MKYILEPIILKPLSNNSPKNAIILCHGFGGDGKDISLLANYWRNYLPDTIFICPDAPEKCAASISGLMELEIKDVNRFRPNRDAQLSLLFQHLSS